MECCFGLGFRLDRLQVYLRGLVDWIVNQRRHIRHQNGSDRKCLKKVPQEKNASVDRNIQLFIVSNHKPLMTNSLMNTTICFLFQKSTLQWRSGAKNPIRNLWNRVASCSPWQSKLSEFGISHSVLWSNLYNWRADQPLILRCRVAAWVDRKDGRLLGCSV